ncbi:anaerobic glycerol-3-phosphate dehydrogenase subunit GlpA [Herpetosiphon sp. NSE202]|uniref:anaerobic glycerol-3-phosphate dehydrogenase subunit GlpA n=1 Tax=Herpetosiphon sp. NSE202 TaxID=3351349 RepID=UPI00362BCC04
MASSTDVLVIGGGATGTGVLRDLAMRGLRCILVERRDLADGTTGRYHGLLHSGARYIGRDREAARDCAIENQILRRIIPHCIEDTNGYFVSTPHDPKRYAEEFLGLCFAAGVPAQQVRVSTLLQREPALNRGISHAFEVADGSADAFLTVEANVRSAREYGGQTLLYHEVIELIVEAGTVVGARLRNNLTGEEFNLACSAVINAAGAWAGKIAAMAGVAVDIVAGKGVMVAFNHRLVNSVINRCKQPGDGDIIVPVRTVCVAGTTDESVPDPDDRSMLAHEIATVLDEGEILIPGLAQARMLRAWAGVRPLYREQVTTDDRELSRDFKVLDHVQRDGVAGFVSIVGGKYTTYRMMAERTVDVVAKQLGNTMPCRTADEAIPAPDQRRLFTVGAPLATIEAEQSYGDLICECELVTRQRLLDAWQAGATSIDDLRRDTRIGMGPCQGGFCTMRTAALAYEAKVAEPQQSVAAIEDFLQERWRGIQPILWGDQLRQARLDEQIYLNLLNVQPEAGQA